MTASQTEKNRCMLMALLAAQADRAELDETINALTRALANAHGVRQSYPPVE